MGITKYADYLLNPIGFVKSPISFGDRMPSGGVEASVELFAKYETGLKRICSNSHILVLGWLQEVDRSTLTLPKHGHTDRGVFGLRSPARINPIGLTAAKITDIQDTEVFLDRIDMFDGTPIIDLKRYSTSWDSIFSARTSRDLHHPGSRCHKDCLQEMFFEGANFHGERCAGVALGARIIDHAVHKWQLGNKDPLLKIIWGPNGCIDDALQAISGATVGNGRLQRNPICEYIIFYGNDSLSFVPMNDIPDSAGEILECDIGSLFNIKGVFS